MSLEEPKDNRSGCRLVLRSHACGGFIVKLLRQDYTDVSPPMEMPIPLSEPNHLDQLRKLAAFFENIAETHKIQRLPDDIKNKLSDENQSMITSILFAVYEAFEKDKKNGGAGKNVFTLDNWLWNTLEHAPPDSTTSPYDIGPDRQSGLSIIE